MRGPLRLPWRRWTAASSPRWTLCKTVCLATPSAAAAWFRGSQPSGACPVTLARSSLVRRMRQGAPGSATGPKERQGQLQLISTLIATVVGVLGLVVAGLAYFLPRAAPSSVPVRIPSSSAGRSSVVVSTDLQARPCSNGGAMKSAAGNDKTIIQFADHSPKTILLYWIDYDGIRQDRGKLLPGGTLAFYTHLTHPWLVADSSGRCLAIFLPVKKPGQASIE
jgi:hypothetical protein